MSKSYPRGEICECDHSSSFILFTSIALHTQNAWLRRSKEEGRTFARWHLIIPSQETTMPDIPLYDDADLGDDPDLLAALTAAFGDQGAEIYSESDSEEAELNTPVGSSEDLAALIARLDRAMESIDTPVRPETPKVNATQAAEKEDRYVVIEFSKQLAAFPLSGITEIERLPAYTSLPQMPRWCVGITNIRGEVISVTSLAALAGAASLGDPRKQKVVIVRSPAASASTALVVDKVIGIRNFTGNTSPRPDDLKSPLADFSNHIARFDNHQILLLDPDLLLGHPEMQPFMNE